MQISPYLTFSGNCAQAIDFYQHALDAALTERHSYRGSPMEGSIPASALDNVMHAELKIFGSTLMLCDAMPGQPTPGGGNVRLLISGETAAQGERIFSALAEGGRVEMPFADQFWGAKFGMLTDRFGVQWSVNVEMKN